MLVDIINKNESTLMIEYNNDVFKFEDNQSGQIEVSSAEFDLSVYSELIDTVDLELEEKKIKNRLFQKGVDKMISLGKKLMVQCKNTYHIKLNNSNAKLVFELDAFGKDNSFAQDFFDMPIDLTSFTRLECEYADIEVVASEATNKKEFLKIYRRLYFWINWNLGVESILFYLPSYIKQKKMISQKHLTKIFKKFYSVSKEERDNLISINTNDGIETNNNENNEFTKKGCLKTFFGIGFLILVMLAILIAIIVFLFKTVVSG